MNRSWRLHGEKLGPALAKIDKRVTVLLRGREVLGIERRETERLKMWRDSEGSQTPDGRRYGF